MSKWRLGDQPAVRLDRLDQSMLVRELQFRFRAEAAPLAQVQSIANCLYYRDSSGNTSGGVSDKQGVAIADAPCNLR